MKNLKNCDDYTLLVEEIKNLKNIVTDLKKEVENRSLARVSEYLTIAQCADFIQCSRSTINRMLKNGDPKYQKAYRRVLIPRNSIDHLLINIVN